MFPIPMLFSHFPSPFPLFFAIHNTLDLSSFPLPILVYYSCLPYVSYFPPPFPAFFVIHNSPNLSSIFSPLLSTPFPSPSLPKPLPPSIFFLSFSPSWPNPGSERPGGTAGEGHYCCNISAPASYFSLQGTTFPLTLSRQPLLFDAFFLPSSCGTVCLFTCLLGLLARCLLVAVFVYLSVGVFFVLFMCLFAGCQYLPCTHFESYSCIVFTFACKLISLLPRSWGFWVLFFRYFYFRM